MEIALPDPGIGALPSGRGRISACLVTMNEADERLSAELRREILALRDAGLNDAAGWSMPRLSYYLGTWIRYGSWVPNRQLRLFDRRHGRWGGGDVHERWETQGRVGRLRRASVLDILLRPPHRFVRGFVLKRGFLLGWRGLILACLDAHSVWLKYTRIMVLQRTPEQDPRR